jgi:hypothetical protein
MLAYYNSTKVLQYSTYYDLELVWRVCVHGCAGVCVQFIRRVLLQKR